MVHASSMPLSLDAVLPGNEPLLKKEVARALGVKASTIRGLRLLKRSVDARKKANVHFVATYEVDLEGDPRLRPAKGVNANDPKPYPALEVKQIGPAFAGSGQPRPVVVGTGPAGLFCALYLARAGMRPLVVERGSSVEKRVGAIEAFNAGGKLNVDTNIQFGEGGAGTFSDGKLNTGTKSPHIRHVLEEFVAAGAPEEILWQAKPHIGTDRLIDVVRNLRMSIIDAGGEVRFNTLMERIELDEEGARVSAVSLRNLETGQLETIPANRVVLACGHSARDTFRMVHDAGFAMERKPFAVGVRIEHPQVLIDESQYGAAHEHPALGAADYKLAVRTSSGRGVYTFCMCPGGEVVAAASEEGGVCVNGMSRFARDGENANSALLVGVEPADFPGDDVLAGVEFQRSLECAAFDLGGGAYRAPAQTVGDFLSGEGERAGRGDRESAERFKLGKSSLVRPTYPRGVTWGDLHQCLPEFVTEAMEEALPLLDRKLAGFAHPEAVMTAVEARSSSPVRIVRGDDFQAMLGQSIATETKAASGLYPCGEGAGYAGGITSAAVDGLRVAEAIVAEFSDLTRACTD
ncbi:MAG: FAD-dependent oxidoreductase [Eggerthellaceae bacterium]|nr:FAD-dependent oxidoreductase [Eggerthellaceae bacterium]